MRVPAPKPRLADADGWLRQLLLFLAAYLLYGASRWVVTGNQASAFEPARWIVELGETLGWPSKSPSRSCCAGSARGLRPGGLRLGLPPAQPRQPVEGRGRYQFQSPSSFMPPGAAAKIENTSGGRCRHGPGPRTRSAPRQRSSTGAPGDPGDER